MKIRVFNDNPTVWEDVQNRLFLWTGEEPKILERDGDVVRYECPDKGIERVTEVGGDVYPLGGLKSLESSLKAIKAWGGHNSRWNKQAPTVGIVAAGHCFVYLHYTLHIRFFKKRGRVPHYLPVTVEEAREVANGEKKLVYWTNSNRAELKAS